MNTAAGGLKSQVEREEQLTDAYTEQLERLRHREPGATTELMRISKELGKDPSGFHDLHDLVELQRNALKECRSHRPVPDRASESRE